MLTKSVLFILVFLIGIANCVKVERVIFPPILIVGCILFLVVFLLVNAIMCCPCRCIFFEPLLRYICCFCFPMKLRRKLAKLESVNQEFCWLCGFLYEGLGEDEEGESGKEEKKMEKGEKKIESEKKPILQERDDYDSIEVEETEEEKSLSINDSRREEEKKKEEDDDDQEAQKLKEKEEKKKLKEQKKKRELQYCRTYVNWVLFSLIFLVIPYETILVWNEFNQLDHPFTCPSSKYPIEYYIRSQPSPIAETTYYIIDLISEKKETYKKTYPVIFGVVNILEEFRPSGKTKLNEDNLPSRYICDLTSNDMTSKNVSVVSFVKIQSFSFLIFFVRSVIELFVVIGAVLAFRKPVMKVLSTFSKVGCTLYMFQWISELFVILLLSIFGITLFIVQIIEFLSDGRAILPNSVFTLWILFLEIIVVWRAGLCYSFTNITCTKNWWKYMIIEPYVKMWYILRGRRKKKNIRYCRISVLCLSWFNFVVLQVYILPRIILWGIPPFVIPNFIAIPVFNQVISIIDVVVIIGMYVSCGCGICLRNAWNENEFRYKGRYRQANFTSSFDSIQRERKKKEEDDDNDIASFEEENEIKKEEEEEEEEGEITVDGNYQVLVDDLEEEEELSGEK